MYEEFQMYPIGTSDSNYPKNHPETSYQNYVGLTVLLTMVSIPLLIIVTIISIANHDTITYRYIYILLIILINH